MTNLCKKPETTFFPSRQSRKRLEEKSFVVLDVEEATGRPRLVAALPVATNPRNGLFVGNNPINLWDPFGLSPCDDFVDFLVGTTGMPGGAGVIGNMMMAKARFGPGMTSKSTPTGGFKPSLVGANKGQVYRHVMGMAGAEIAGADAIARQQMQSDINQLSDPKGNRAEEAKAEVAADKAGTETGKCMKDTIDGKTSQDQLREQLKKILCQ